MVRAAREGYAMSQDALSRRLKDDTDVVIDQSGIARLEAGRRAVRLNEVVALAQVLGIDISQSTFAVQPDKMDENMLERAQIELAEIQMEVHAAFEDVRRHEAALEMARARLVEMRATESILQRRFTQVLEYRRALDELRGSLRSESDSGRPGETVREAAARKRQGADNGDR